jgi:hypothetical protein
LAQEGRDVTVGIVRRLEKLGLKDEEPETAQERSTRLILYDGLLKKRSSESVMEMLRRVPRAARDDYFIFFDFNSMYNLAEEVIAMGFKHGLLPTEWYYKMEKERPMAKKFVKDNYPEIKVADSHGFARAQEGIKFLNETEGVYVLKSNGNHGKTLVPKTDDPQKAKKLLVEALTENRKDYELGGFLLEEKIPNCLEVTPVMVFYDGKPVYTLVEFESKELGAGNIGLQKGGNLALSVKTPLNCALNRMAFPKAVYDLAKKQPGLSIYDMGLLWNGKDFYFTEFCAMRYGWDGIFSEMVMADEGKPFVGNYFEDIMAGRNPLSNTFGVSVRLFNFGGHMEGMDKSEDDVVLEWPTESDNNLFVYRMKKLENKKVTVGGLDLMGVATGASNVLETAVGKAYAIVDSVDYDTKYFRPKFDFLSVEYKSSILNRYNAMKKFIEEEKK